MREPPDRLTERVWQMLATACISSMTREKVIEQLTSAYGGTSDMWRETAPHAVY